jgi:hypothetical protein
MGPYSHCTGRAGAHILVAVTILRGRLVGVALALVGLVFTIVGIALVATANWTTVEGTVAGQCQARFTGTVGSPGRHVQHICPVTWTYAGATHTAPVTLNQKRALYPGTRLTLQVSGDSATEPSPTWVRVGILVLGILLLAGGVLVLLRSRRSHRGAAALPGLLGP